MGPLGGHEDIFLLQRAFLGGEEGGGGGGNTVSSLKNVEVGVSGLMC